MGLVLPFIHPVTRSSVHLKMMRDNITLATGTGLLYNLENRMYIITNWHNITGLHSEQLYYLHSKLSTPNTIIATMPASPYWKDQKINYISRKIALYDGRESLWFEHGVYGHRIDIAGISVDPAGLDGQAANLATPGKFILSPGLDVFAIGYPEGITSGGFSPIWKRGSIASEPHIDIDGRPIFYIDMASKRGMSGSPVFAALNFLNPLYTSSIDYGDADSGIQFVGIYSGRQGTTNDTFSESLGIVWHDAVIRGTISLRRPGPDPETIARPKTQTL